MRWLLLQSDRTVFRWFKVSQPEYCTIVKCNKCGLSHPVKAGSGSDKVYDPGCAKHREQPVLREEDNQCYLRLFLSTIPPSFQPIIASTGGMENIRNEALNPGSTPVSMISCTMI